MRNEGCAGRGRNYGGRVTSDQTITLWATLLTGLPTIVFTGWMAFWTWRRDQERIIVLKVPSHWETLDGTKNDLTLCGLGIVVRNLSLFPVRIVALGFFYNGNEVLEFKRFLGLETDWPLELASHARMIVYASEDQWAQVKESGLHTKIMDRKFIAIAMTETGGWFSSNRLSVRILRPFRAARNWFLHKKAQFVNVQK